MVLPSGNIVYGNWQDSPGQPPRFNVTRKEGLSEDFLEEFNKPQETGADFLAQYIQKNANEIAEVADLNFLNPLNWFSRKADAAIKEADKGGTKKYQTNSLAGSLLERRRALAELQKGL